MTASKVSSGVLHQVITSLSKPGPLRCWVFNTLHFKCKLFVSYITESNEHKFYEIYKQRHGGT